MSSLNRIIATTLLTVCLGHSSSAQTFTTLFTFDQTDGSSPSSALVQGRDGNLYGTTVDGGSTSEYCFGGSCGTVFKITPNGVFTTLYSFCSRPQCSDGYAPWGGLTLGTDGNFYGTTGYGGIATHSSCPGGNGCGTVFRITPDGLFSTIYSFGAQSNLADGDYPIATLLLASDGDLYGTTWFGGDPSSNCCGTIFKINRSGNGAFSTIYTFSSSAINGAAPNSLIEGTDGNFYATTYLGGTGEYGTVFRFSPGGKLRTLYDFCTRSSCSNGEGPSEAPLVQTTEGTIFGTTLFGGSNGDGTIFRLVSGGGLRFVSLSNSDGIYPASVIQATDGQLYGAANYGGTGSCMSGCGTIFDVVPQTGEINALYSFNAAEPFAVGGLLQHTTGVFYGTTSGGSNDRLPGYGTVFSFDTGLGPFVAFVQRAGRVNQTAEILGQAFTGTSRVSFNGVAANFSVVSDTYLTATVPQGATTGYIAVTTPTGTLTSNVPFYVIP